MKCNPILLLTIIALTILGCKTNAKLKPKNTDLKGFSTFQDTEFHTLTDFQSEIETCLQSNKNIHLHGKHLSAMPEIEKMDRTYLIHSPIENSFPDRFEYEHFTLEFVVCANPEGDIVLSKLISESVQLWEKESNALTESLLKNKFSADSSADCLDCKKLIVNK